MAIIPTSSPVYHQLQNLASSADIVVFSGLPGTGKSLYINEFYHISKALSRKLTVIQWDIARKAFETEKIMKLYPMKDSMVHDAVKLMAGVFLLEQIKKWYKEKDDTDLLLIEAPLVGGRFIELVELHADPNIELILSNHKTQIVMPIPSVKVREIIEAERAKQVNEDAKVWIGAKPSVMKILWKHVCEIAQEFGKDLELDINYDPQIVEYVFKKVTKHRNFLPLYIDELFDVPAQDELGLHNLSSLKASEKMADQICDLITDKYPDVEQMNKKTSQWYRQ